ncbi:MAG: Gfo/Idh/MocA family oxidoreductase [Actinobacteria bacterium]|nr:Gfo/Idh/MocA family oxidoreductase [Actinomycetota bacterium]
MATVAVVTDQDGAHLSAYYEGLKSVRDVSEVVLVDPSGTLRQDAQAVLEDRLTQTYASVDAMLKAVRPAMAIVTLPGDKAPAQIAPLVNAGVPVLAEKPACVDPDGFARLVDLAARTNVQIMLALANRIAPWLTDARRIVQDGGIGRLYAIQALSLADQTRIQRRRDDPHWSFRKARAGGGYLTWLGIHWLDALLTISGDRVTAVQAMTAVAGGAPIDVEDLAVVHLQLASGAQASLTCGYLLDTYYQWNMAFWGADGWLRYDWNNRVLDWHGNDPQAMNEVKDRHIRYEGDAGYTPFVRAAFRAAVGEIGPPITSAEGLTVLRIIQAAYRSAASGQTVKL